MTLHNRAEYEAAAIAAIVDPFRRIPAPGSVERGDETQLYRFVLDHVQALKVAIQNYNAAASINPKIDIRAFNDFVADEIPDELAFDERMSDARRGY